MASADYSVLTPERVSLEYGIAGIGSRGAAAVVDTLVQFLAIAVLGVGLFAVDVALTPIMGSSAADALSGSLLIALFVLGLFLVTSGYFLIFEIVWSGQTPGKRLVGLRVIRESGYPIRPVDAVIRNLVRIVDWLPFFYGVGVLAMLINHRSKRLGDFASGTIVVREGARGPSLTFSPPVQAAPEPSTFTLSAADATLVRDFLVRRQGLDRNARAELARRLRTALAQRYHLPLEAESDPEGFLERLNA